MLDLNHSEGGAPLYFRKNEKGVDIILKRRGKRILGGVLAAVMAASMGASAFAASAAETQADTSLPQGVTQDLVDQAVTNMDKNIVSILSLVGLDWNTVVSNKTVGEFIGTVNSLLQSIDTGGMLDTRLQTMELWAAFDRLPENPFDEYFDLDVTEIPLTELDYGVANGDVDAFIAAVKDIFKSMLVYMITALAVAGDDAMGMPAPTEPNYNGMLGQMLGISVPEPLYRFALYPVFEDLGLKALTPDEASAEMLELTMNSSVVDTSELQKAYNAAVRAKQDGSADLEQLKAEYLELAQGMVDAYGGCLDIYYAPIFDLVAQVLKAPLTSIVNLLPKLDAMIQSGEYGWLFDLLGQLLPDMFPADAAPANLVELVNGVLANVQVNGAALGLTLPAFDFAALDEMSMADRTVATVNYLTDTITTEENLAAITALIPAAGAILGGLSSDDLGYVVINFLATGSLSLPGEDPGTGDPTDPTDPGTQDPTNPGTQDPTDPGREPSTTDPVDTGDAALSAVVFAAAAAAAGVIALSRRKK